PNPEALARLRGSAVRHNPRGATGLSTGCTATSSSFGLESRPEARRQRQGADRRPSPAPVPLPPEGGQGRIAVVPGVEKPAGGRPTGERDRVGRREPCGKVGPR